MRAVLAVVVLAVLVVACGGVERLSAAEYLSELEARMIELRAGEDELARMHPAPPDDAPLEVIVATLRETYEAYEGLRAPFAGYLNQLEPPSRFSNAHDRLAENAEEVADGQSEAVRLLGEVRVLVDVQAAFRHLFGPTQLFTEACKELQSEADAIEIGVDLLCES